LPGFTIRTATLQDIGAVLALWREAGAHETVGAHRDGLARLLASDGEALLVAEAEDRSSQRRTVGSLIASWDGWRGSFYRLAVHPDRRREGLATQLVREGERRLHARGAERLAAIVAEEDPGAHEFWLAAGYELQPGRERFVRQLGR
jgi:ribosomal protein S18 acetylase RimI-like enzyme